MLAVTMPVRYVWACSYFSIACKRFRIDQWMEKAAEQGKYGKIPYLSHGTI